ncbi:hypothetical protein [Zhongshania sp. BJYM1]|uniref:hypothetical protein n=1 Tax=Zhongshania aquatica TaxID=2965069 RepID=UPI0022B51FFD|nr:hypothetical protein [Marortus sp. BJYM1]
MTLVERLFSGLIARHGTRSVQWPYLLRILLPVFLSIESCSRCWRAAQVEEEGLRNVYANTLPELEPSAGLQARLASIAQPRKQLVREPFIPVWRWSFATAMASALLGVVLGAGGYFADYTDPDTYTFDATASYEVSNWIAGADL